MSARPTQATIVLAVIGVDLDYENIAAGSGSMLMVSASGTAVVIE